LDVTAVCKALDVVPGRKVQEQPALANFARSAGKITGNASQPFAFPA
jgi:hypothetical protein